MANYVTQTSDKSRAVALQKWKKGCFGVFGLETFYVGKIARGIGHFAAGLFFFEFVFAALYGIFTEFNFAGIIPVSIYWAILAVPNLYRLKMGTFRDNIGAVLRE